MARGARLNRALQGEPWLINRRTDAVRRVSQPQCANADKTIERSTVPMRQFLYALYIPMPK